MSELAPGGGLAGVIAGWFGLGDLVPYGPVLTPQQREAYASQRPSGVTYTGPRRVEAPVPPLQIFGVTYDLDLVLVSKHPSWHMHEYARLATPEGPVWLAKDARTGTLEQSIVAQIDDIESFLPEVGVPRKSATVEVVDHSTSTTIDLQIRYDNIDGEPVEVTYRGPFPSALESRRNTSTMGHSRGSVMAVLDMPHKTFARSVSMTIGGRPQPIDRILGLVPFQLALIQTQAGFSIGRWTQQGSTTTHASGASQTWQLHDHGDHVDWVQCDPLRTLRYRFRRQGDALELERATVEPWDRATPACAVQFVPPLPDAALPFTGTYEGRFVVDVNGQASHCIGQVRATSTEAGTTYDLQPTAPAWCADRPMRAVVQIDAEVRVEMTRTS